MNELNLFGRAADRLAAYCRRLAAVVLWTMLGIVTAGVIARWWLPFSVRGVDQISGYLLVSLSYIGFVFALREGGFIQAQLLYDRVSDRVRAGFDVFAHLTGLAVVILIAYWITMSLIESYERGSRVVGVVELPVYAVKVPMLIGVYLLALQLTLLTLELMVDLRRHGVSERQAASKGPSGVI